MEFLVRGVLDYGEPGVFVSFEESAEDLAANVASLGFDLVSMQRRRQLLVEEVRVDPTLMIETGPFDLEALFLRVGLAVDTVKATRIVFDTIEVLFAGIPNPGIVRAELVRLFRWLKDRGLTALVTAEKGDGTLTRHGLEEYVADCVIVLDHRASDQLSTRRLRVAKYRGSLHGTNEYPFLIDQTGISVLPITSFHLQHAVSSERIESGISRLDHMLGGGAYRGSSVMVTGVAGTGKSTLAATYADAACRRGERALYVSFDESEVQIVRNMQSVGLQLGAHVKSGRLRFLASRPSVHGLEMHLLSIHKAVEDFRPTVVIIDPITDLGDTGTPSEVRATLTRLVDYLKTSQITAVLTALRTIVPAQDSGESWVSSLVDTWIGLDAVDSGGERNHCLLVAKSRGTSHSNQMREYLITDHGMQISDAYLGAGDVLTGSARVAQQARERDDRESARVLAETRRGDLERRELLAAARLGAVEAERAAIRRERKALGEESDKATALAAADLRQMVGLRTSDANDTAYDSARGTGAGPQRGRK